MALTTCEECGKSVSDQAASCLDCGAPLHRRPAGFGFTPLFLGAALVIGALFALGVTASNSPDSQDKAKERRAIELCWDEHGGKSITPSEQRFIAGACEKMENDFQQRYGVKP